MNVCRWDTGFPTNQVLGQVFPHSGPTRTNFRAQPLPGTAVSQQVIAGLLSPTVIFSFFSALENLTTLNLESILLYMGSCFDRYGNEKANCHTVWKY